MSEKEPKDPYQIFLQTIKDLYQKNDDTIPEQIPGIIVDYLKTHGTDDAEKLWKNPTFESCIQSFTVQQIYNFITTSDDTIPEDRADIWVASDYLFNHIATFLKTNADNETVKNIISQTLEFLPVDPDETAFRKAFFKMITDTLNPHNFQRE